MAKTRRRVLSILMALVLTLGLLPTAALAGFGGGSGGQATNGSDAYFYILKPNLTSGSYIPDATDDDYINLWDYVGKGKLNRGNPQYGDSKYTYTYNANEVETFPAMPSISYKGKTYTYEQSGMVAGTYQVTWVRFVDANGWNDGKIEYDSGKPTWHVDGYVTFCDVNSYQVTYTVIGENDGFPVHTEAVNSGAYAQGYTYTGYDTSRYEFKGWYTDKACTQAYDFQAPVTKNLNLYGKLVEKTYTPSVAPTATLTLTKKWDNVAPGTDTVNISVGSVNKSVTVGQETELTFTGLTPNQQYTITETPDNYLLDKSTITLSGDLLTGMTFNAIERYESCNNLTTEDLDGANAIVAALTGHQNDDYVVWTYQELSDNEKAEFVEAFLEANIKGPYNQITVGNTEFISGPNASYGAKGVIVNAANGTLTFDATKVWAQFVTGTYGYLYGGEGATVTNSPKVGSLTINKTFSYEGTTNTSAPTGFGATFVVKNESGTPVASLTYADLSDLTKNPITNLPYGTYTVEETNITGTLAPAYNPNPTVSYDDGTDGTGKTDNQIILNAPSATMAVNNYYSLTNSPIVGITKTATQTATAGDTITYTITVTNTGGGAATNVQVTDELPDGLVKEKVADVTLTPEAGTSCSYDPTTETVTWAIPALAAQTGEAELTVKVKVADSALSLDKITNTAYMETYNEYQGDPIPAHAETKITKSNLSIAKSASSTSDNTGATAKPGDTITYTITVTNSGDADAKGKTVIDTLPSAGLQNINAGTGNYDKDQNTITWRDLTIPAGETVTLTVTAIVAPLANTSQGITLVNNVAMDDLSDSVTTRVGATTATLTIEKYVTGLPAADTAAWNALVNAVSFTVTGQPESGETFTPVTVDLDEFQSTVSGVYTYSLENLAPGTYTVTENGYDVLSTYGYTWNAENSAASVEKTVTAGVPASAAIRNEYDSREFTIIFDSNTNGVLLNRDRSTVAMGSSFRYGWIVPSGNETVSTGPSWSGALVGETFNGSPNSQVSYTFTKAEYLEYGNHNTYSMAFSQPGVTANNGYSFTGSFTTTGAAEDMKFESLANTMAYLLANGDDQITYYANYTANGTQPNPDPIEPGPNPDPIEPGPSDPGTDIPDDNTPTTDLPEEETPTTELPDEETPMTEEPVEELPDEEVPMAEVPATGDTAGLWALAAGVSGLALVWLALSGKKRREENA